MLPFTMRELTEAIEDGSVSRRPHPSLQLYIYNYSPMASYAGQWNEVTLNCRGLILDGFGNVVARPWKKFFNLGQVNLPIQFDDPVEVMNKMDGSLGIVYPTPDGFAIATRGSFESEQAIHATKVWQEKYTGLVIPKGYTFLFEIVFPSNRIVLDYHGLDDLVLLGAVETATGYYHGPREAAAYLGWTGPVVEVFEHRTLSDALGDVERPNAEGFVIRSHNFMVKIKQPDYLEIHRLVTNITPKNIWKQLSSGLSMEQACSVYPDEFHEYVRSLAEPLQEKYDTRLNELLAEFSRIDKSGPRKDFALRIVRNPNKKYFFMWLDERPIRDALWTELQPKEESRADPDHL